MAGGVGILEADFLSRQAVKGGIGQNTGFVAGQVNTQTGGKLIAELTDNIKGQTGLVRTGCLRNRCCSMNRSG
jgi:hypothetical protein